MRATMLASSSGMNSAAGARRSMLCAACAAALAWAQPTDNETDRIRESTMGLFSLLDANRNGMLNKVELLQRESVAISDVRSLGIAVEDGEGLLQACDADGNRAISEEELWVCLSHASTAPAMSSYDTDRASWRAGLPA